MFDSKVGLFFPFNVLFEGHPWWLNLIICVGVSPFLMWFIGLVVELRFVPIWPTKQFWGYFPGDLFLALAASTFLYIAQQGGGPGKVYVSLWWVQLVIFIGALAVAVIMTRGEYQSGDYTAAALTSPTKIYHNFGLYWLYGYVVFSAAAAAIVNVFVHFDGRLLLILIGGLLAIAVWGFCTFFMDNIMVHFGGLTMPQKAKLAHPGDWLQRWAAVFRTIGG